LLKFSQKIINFALSLRGGASAPTWQSIQCFLVNFEIRIDSHVTSLRFVPQNDNFTIHDYFND